MDIMNKKTTVSVRLELSKYIYLDKKAASEETTINKLCYKIISDYLAKEMEETK